MSSSRLIELTTRSANTSVSSAKARPLLSRSSVDRSCVRIESTSGGIVQPFCRKRFGLPRVAGSPRVDAQLRACADELDDDEHRHTRQDASEHATRYADRLRWV